MNVNVLNTTQLLDSLKALAKDQPQNVAEWLLSTYLRFQKTLESGNLKQCVSERRVNDPIVFLASGKSRKAFDASAKQFHAVDTDTLEPWGLRALRRNELFYWDGYKKSELTHWIDFLRTRPNRQLKYTVPDLITAVEEWDGTMRRRKLLTSLTEGTEMIADGEANGHDIVLVKLLTKPAYDAESVVMTNCVDTYYKRLAEGTWVYSLRQPGVTESIATIEVDSKQKLIVQYEGPKRAATLEIYFEAARLMFERLGFEFEWNLTNGYVENECDINGEDEACGEDSESEDDEPEVEDREVETTEGEGYVHTKLCTCTGADQPLCRFCIEAARTAPVPRYRGSFIDRMFPREH